MENKTVNPAETVGVIVARFEVAALTTGHKQMLDYVLSKGYGTNLIILGVSPLMTTKINPLDFEARRLMLEQEYPGKFTILYLKDVRDDYTWSDNLDSMIDDVRGMRNVVLIGSRDSFYNGYHGKFKNNFEEYKQQIFVSGTQQRASLARQLKSSYEWRAGVVYATQNQYPTVYSTVDCAIFDSIMLKSIYLAKKRGEKQLRFVGGFADPKDDSFEMTAKREAKEETGLEANTIAYVCSMKVDDWRYAAEENKIITHLFAMVKVYGRPDAFDDISELHLVEFEKITPDMIVPEHVRLFEKLVAWRNEYIKNHIDMRDEVSKQLD